MKQDQPEFKMDIARLAMGCFIFIKLIVAFTLIGFGIHIAVWAYETVEVILMNPEQVNLLAQIMKYETVEQVISIQKNGETMRIEYTDFFKYVIFLILVVVFFGVIGRSIMALLSSGVSVLNNLGLDLLKSEPQSVVEERVVHVSPDGTP